VDGKVKERERAYIAGRKSMRGRESVYMCRKERVEGGGLRAKTKHNRTKMTLNPNYLDNIPES